MLKTIITSLSMFVLFIRLFSQPYPVDAFLQMRPPFPPYLEALSDGFPPSMAIQLLMQDNRETNYPVGLRFSINGEGISIRTNPDFRPSPILLDYGLPMSIQQEVLAAYFLPENLIIQGINQNNYLQSGGKLPEGIYNFCVEVIDQVRLQGAPLSNQACTVVELSELDPPIITFPLSETHVPINSPILFQWVPQHIGAFPVQYTLRLYEQQPALGIVQTLAATTPVYETTSAATSFLYEQDKPPLTPGKKYLTQVQIQAVLEDQHFKNQGYSAVSTFVFGDDSDLGPPACQLNIKTLLPIEVNANGFTARWLATPGAEAYEITLSEDSLFTQLLLNDQYLSVTDTFIRVSGLPPSKWYYYRLRARVGDCFSDESTSIAVFLGDGCQNQAQAPLTYVCGTALDSSLLSAAPLIQHLQKGDNIWANDFQITLTEVAGQGTFYGKGYVAVPYLQEARLNVTLKGIKIDQHCRLVSGYLDATGVGLALVNEDLAAALSDILDALETVEAIFAASETILQGIDQIIAEAEPYLPDNIMQALIEAQAAFNQAQIAYAAAIESGDATAITQAEEALEAAKAKLEKALTDYKAALGEFFNTLLQVMVAMFKELLDDCLMDQLSLSYQNALNALDQLVETSNQQALASLPFSSSPSNPAAFRTEYEEVYFEAIKTPPQVFDQLANDFYDKEMSYLLCLSFEKLQDEIDTPEEVNIFQSLFKDLGVSSFEIIGEKIKQGWAAEAIVPAVKEQLVSDLMLLLKKVNYPNALTTTN